MKKILLILVTLTCILVLIWWITLPDSSQNIDTAPNAYVSFMAPDVSSSSTTNRRQVFKPDFKTLLIQEPSSSFKPVLETTYSQAYQIYACPRTDGKEDKAVVLIATFDGDLEDGYRTTKTAVSNWEPNVFIDIGHLLFPSEITTPPIQQVNFQRITIDNPHIAMADDFKRASVTIQGQQKYIYSAWILNYVMFASSQTCLEESLKLLYHVH